MASLPIPEMPGQLNQSPPALPQGPQGPPFVPAWALPDPDSAFGGGVGGGTTGAGEGDRAAAWADREGMRARIEALEAQLDQMRALVERAIPAISTGSLYVAPGGALTYRGANGTVSVVAPA